MITARLSQWSRSRVHEHKQVVGAMVVPVWSEIFVRSAGGCWYAMADDERCAWCEDVVHDGVVGGGGGVGERAVSDFGLGTVRLVRLVPVRPNGGKRGSSTWYLFGTHLPRPNLSSTADPQKRTGSRPAAPSSKSAGHGTLAETPDLTPNVKVACLTRIVPSCRH